MATENQWQPFATDAFILLRTPSSRRGGRGGRGLELVLRHLPVALLVDAALVCLRELSPLVWPPPGAHLLVAVEGKMLAHVLEHLRLEPDQLERRDHLQQQGVEEAVVHLPPRLHDAVQARLLAQSLRRNDQLHRVPAAAFTPGESGSAILFSPGAATVTATSNSTT
eukprot:CAMPEP_0114624214 /NCGR_PEP_ID=MMETSP0168-20121206/10654_2 /TAXON_ID=95228 ORGANISM="Vannella sp., Strain DIVA3 517/6/12" /NCGR_SAMPLE_ID=MMETSP0168 /ASSEMBLY_ACC=CAM_ASM_000044 /LENGTH=166 /DNA_ID=CAMNT_0001835487 /DNA_START=14 /DNA_END=511 /DNA_ORIENTATION=-